MEQATPDVYWRIGPLGALVIYLQDILGYSAFQTGLRFLPLTIPIILAAPSPAGCPRTCRSAC